MVIWYILWPFGMLHEEKSGNTELGAGGIALELSKLG
jgi:hypothetical protein